VSDEVPDRPPGAGLVQALHVPRNLAVGAVVGLLLALSMYLVRVLELFGPFQGTRSFPVLGVGGWYLLLAFVLASSTAVLVATVLTLGSAYRLARATGEESSDGESPDADR
jgi:hypothetical protein